MTGWASPGVPRPRVLCPHCGRAYNGVPVKGSRDQYTARRHETRELLGTSPDAITVPVLCPGSYQAAKLDMRGLR